METEKLEKENAVLRAAFLNSNAAMRYYRDGNRGQWTQVGEQFKEKYIEEARRALDSVLSTF